MNNKIKAFTLMEITVTMLIAALVMSITYSAYLLVNKSFLTYTAKQDEMAELISLDRLLKKDMERAKMIRQADGGISLQDTSGLIRYQFLPDRIVRQAVNTDTFYIKTGNLSLFFEGRTVDSNDTQAVDELFFNVLFHKEIFPSRYHKIFSSVELYTPAANNP